MLNTVLISSILYTEATRNIKDEIEKDLEKLDPSLKEGVNLMRSNAKEGDFLSNDINADIVELPFND